VWGYHYMKDSAELILNSIQNTVNDNPSVVYNWAINSQTNIDYTWATNGQYFNIINNITENINNRFNLTSNSLTDYGKLNPINSTYTKDLTFSNDIINLEFWSQFVYHAEDFNILRDGIDSQYNKKFIGNWYDLYERYFDASLALWNSYSTSDNDNASFYVDSNIENKFMQTSTNDDSYKVQYKAEQWKNFQKWWYVSYIKYFVEWEWIHIPSISRWVSWLWNMDKASAYYPTISASWWISHLTQDIAINWLVNKADGLSNIWPQIWLTSLDLDRPYTRAELLEKLKKKIFTVNKVGNWCTWTNSTLNETVWNSNSCTFNLNWELVSFYDLSGGNIDIDCGTTCNVTDKRTIIVKDGRITIKSNINTNNASGNGQLLIASITDKWLNNIDVINDFDDISKQSWWIAIDEEVTNIDGFLLSQWPLVSSDSSSDNIMIHYNNIDKLLNQLHIYGSVFSLNTIGWENIWKCPYIETSCNQDTAKIYDLSFLRRYALVDAVQFNWVSWKVPFDPNLDFSVDVVTKAKSSGGLQYKNDWTPSWATTLRTARVNHLTAPIIVERDNKWSTNSSYFAQD
jgi:hypothetical protein